MNYQAQATCCLEKTLEAGVGVKQRTDPERASTSRQARVQNDSLESTMITMPSVLLVDDNRKWSDATAEYLADEGFKVSTAIDGVDALNRLLTNEFEVVVLDINMPRMNGFEMMLEMKRMEIDTPVIMVTAKPEDFDESTVLATGARMYIPKPIDMETLVDAIDRYATR